MTTTKPRSTTASKLAGSVRRAKAKPTTAENTAPVNQETEKAILKSESVSIMPSRRVWPD